MICFFATLILSHSYLKLHTEKDSDLMLLEKVPQTIQQKKKQHTGLTLISGEFKKLWQD